MINAVNLRPGDIVVLHIGVGDMPSSRVKVFTDEIKKLVREVIGTDNQILGLPAIGTNGTNISIINKVA